MELIWSIYAQVIFNLGFVIFKANQLSTLIIASGVFSPQLNSNEKISRGVTDRFAPPRDYLAAIVWANWQGQIKY